MIFILPAVSILKMYSHNLFLFQCPELTILLLKRNMISKSQPIIYYIPFRNICPALNLNIVHFHEKTSYKLRSKSANPPQYRLGISPERRIGSHGKVLQQIDAVETDVQRLPYVTGSINMIQS